MMGVEGGCREMELAIIDASGTCPPSGQRDYQSSKIFDSTKPIKTNFPIHYKITQSYGIIVCLFLIELIHL